MIQVICCSSLLSAPGRAGAFSRALKIEKLKAQLIIGAGDTNDWCITSWTHNPFEFSIKAGFALGNIFLSPPFSQI